MLQDRSHARYTVSNAPFHASKIRTFSMASGPSDFDQDQMLNNNVPVRVLVGL